MNFKTLSVAALFLAVSPAWAAKYMVVFKNSQTFAQAHSQWVLSNNSLMNRMFSAAQAPLEVVESLEHVRSLVVESSDEALVSSLSANSDVIVEKEFFHKAPAPVTDFGLTEPWTFHAQYAVAADVQRKNSKNSILQPMAPAIEGEGVNTPWGIKAVKAREAWTLAKRGEGARVLVLDTGIDKNHPALKNQIEEMKDFVGDNQAPYDVADTIGHGTHVAGTIAAEEAADGFVGVAPKARLLVGRVCSKDGCSNIDVARGINWGVEKNVDVINMSLGGEIGSQAESMAVKSAEQAGVIVVAASGNDSKGTVAFPGAFPTVIAVGAVDSTLVKAGFSQWGPELDVVAPGVEVTSSVPMGTGCAASAILTNGSASESLRSTCFSGSAFLNQGLKKDLVYVGLGKPQDFVGKDLQGKFALISRGEIFFTEKVQNALAANAMGVVIFNNTIGLMGGSITEDGSLLNIPVVMIEKTAGEKITAELATGKVVSLEVATMPTDFSDYSGTSMASPHVAGVVALVRATNKRLSPVAVRDLLKKTATPMGPNDENQYGSGMVNAEKAVTQASRSR